MFLLLQEKLLFINFNNHKIKTLSNKKVFFYKKEYKFLRNQENVCFCIEVKL